METKFEIGLHTVIILVGPSQSGKSTWANIFAQKITSLDNSLRCSIISSDAIRRELLGQDYDRYDNRMMQASAPAFELLKAKLQAHMTFPVNNEFIIVDTTGLDNQFRFDISQLARDNAYRCAVVAFDYSTSEYFESITERTHKEIISHHVETFKKRVLPNISRKNFDFSFTVREKTTKYFENLKVVIPELAVWNNSKLDPSRPVAFIGDIHEHVSVFEELLKKIPSEAQVVLIGDYLDKGGNTSQIIECVEKAVHSGAKLIVGNHESFVARRLRGEVSALEQELELFSSLKVLLNDKTLAQRFLYLYDQSIPYAYYSTDCVSAYGTHAPCKNKYIGKHSEFAKKSQRNYYFKEREIPGMAQELSFIELEAKNSHPWHIFGHVAHKLKKIECKNKVWLDTGAVYGGHLTSFIIYPDGKTKTIQVRATKLADTNLFYFPKDYKATPEPDNKPENNDQKTPLNIMELKPQNSSITQLIEKYNLQEKDRYWLMDFAKSGACFIAGTMSPSKSSAEKLEPVSTALDYFKSKGIENVVMQPKFMGSRVQIYLNENSEEDFLITRSGHKSKISEEFKLIFNALREQTKSVWNWKNHIILDGELMPWTAIGQDLIDREFTPYGMAFLKENEILKNDEMFKKLNQTSSYDAAWNYSHAQIFMQQLEIYAKQSDIHFVAFNVLKMDNKLYPMTSHEVFSVLNPDKQYMVIELNQDNALLQAQNFFDNLTNNELSHEGVVIKPLEDRNLQDCAPYMKVRNENYLHLIYGYDYMQQYEKMCAQKRIGKKLALSIKEYVLGKKMLQASNQTELLEVACQMLFELNQEQELDTRL